MNAPWFDPNTFGAWFGAIGGTIGGLLGAGVGTIGGILLPRGKGRGLVMGMLVLMIVLGLASLGFGLVALVAGQPYGIWYGPVLTGLIGSILGGGLVGTMGQIARAVEQRKMAADDLRRS